MGRKKKSVEEVRKGIKKASKILQREGRKLQGIGEELSLTISAPLAMIQESSAKATGNFDESIEVVKKAK